MPNTKWLTDKCHNERRHSIGCRHICSSAFATQHLPLWEMLFTCLQLNTFAVPINPVSLKADGDHCRSTFAVWVIICLTHFQLDLLQVKAMLLAHLQFKSYAVQAFALQRLQLSKYCTFAAPHLQFSDYSAFAAPHLQFSNYSAFAAPHLQFSTLV